MTCYASVAQLVEHNLAKVGVASSNLVSRSKVLDFLGLFLCPITKKYEQKKSPVSGAFSLSVWLNLFSSFRLAINTAYRKLIVLLS